jgi:hypothetical protein
MIPTSDMPNGAPPVTTAGSGLRLHAPRFVPQRQRDINLYSAKQVHYCPYPDYVDFKEYALSFLPKTVFENAPSTQLLQAIESDRHKIGVVPDGPQIPLSSLSPELYGCHFRNGLIEEKRELQAEFKQYNLYDVRFLEDPKRKDWYIVTVPGLREYVPGVFAGDVIIIRGVRYPGRNLFHNYVGPQFDGNEYVAYIWSIDRQKVSFV